MVNNINYNPYFYSKGMTSIHPQYFQPPLQGLQNYAVSGPVNYNPYSNGQNISPYKFNNIPAPYFVNYQTPVMSRQLENDTFQKTQYKIPNVKTNKTKLSLFFINDMHGHLDNMTNILGASMQYDLDVKKKGADSIKLSGGDNFAGGDAQKNSLMLNFLDHIGIKASATGNHEFDTTASTFYDIKQNTKTKFLAANADVPPGSKFYDNVQKSLVIEENGNKYGVVGLMPVDLETVASKTEGLEGIKPYSLEESVKAAQQEIDKLRAQGINKIILLNHIGLDKDTEIAPMLDGIDIIQGGHSHNLTPELKVGENVVKNKSGEPVIIVQGGENGKYAGVLDVDFNEDGIITAASLNINKAELEKSPVLEYIKTGILGKSAQIGQLKYADPLPENRRITPCAWTNLLCDAMRAEINTDLAFINAANTRKVPKPGILTERDISESTPMKNTLVKTKMTEKEVVSAIKNSLQKTLQNPTGEPGIIHASGLEYKATSEGKLLEMNFVDKNGNKIGIDINNPSDDKIYSVCCDSFVTAQRENAEYPELVLANHKYKDAEYFDFDKDKAAIEYIKKLQTKDALVVTDDKRIQIIEPNGSLRTAQK